jgi:hypothetical protein
LTHQKLYTQQQQQQTTWAWQHHFYGTHYVADRSHFSPPGSLAGP